MEPITQSHSLSPPDLRLVVVAGVLLFVVGKIPVLRWAVYPLALLHVFVHELSHIAAMALTGGRAHRFVVWPNLTGRSSSMVRDGCTITIAGFVGAAAVGAGLIMLAQGAFPPRAIVIVAGVALGFLCLWYARNCFGLVTGLILSAVLVYAGMRLDDRGAQLLLWLLGIQLVLEAFTHLLGLGRWDGLSQDAADIAKLTGGPIWLWSLVMAVLVAALVYLAFRAVYGLPLPWG